MYISTVGDHLDSGPTLWKPSTTSFGTPSIDSKGSVSTPRARTEFKTGLFPAYKSFQSTRHDVESRPIHAQSSECMFVRNIFEAQLYTLSTVANFDKVFLYIIRYCAQKTLRTLREGSPRLL